MEKVSVVPVDVGGKKYRKRIKSVTCYVRLPLAEGLMVRGARIHEYS